MKRIATIPTTIGEIRVSVFANGHIDVSEIVKRGVAYERGGEYASEGVGLTATTIGPFIRALMTAASAIGVVALDENDPCIVEHCGIAGAHTKGAHPIEIPQSYVLVRDPEPCARANCGIAGPHFPAAHPRSYPKESRSYPKE